VIRNVVVHISNEQPLLADMYALPSATDAGLVCTNVRMLDGKRPIFIDRTESVFFFPYRAIRFLEIPPEQMARHLAEGGVQPGAAAAGADASTGAMAGMPGGAGRLPVPVPDGEPELAPDEPDADLEIDEDFLRRVRDI
jgi:hypothetical protein